MSPKVKKIILSTLIAIVVLMAAGYFYMKYQSQKTEDAAKDPTLMQEEFSTGFDEMDKEAGKSNP